MSWHRRVFDFKLLFTLREEAMTLVSKIITGASFDLVAQLIDILDDASEVEKKLAAFEKKDPTHFKSAIYGYLLDVERNPEPREKDYKAFVKGYEETVAWFARAKHEIKKYVATRHTRSNPRKKKR